MPRLDLSETEYATLRRIVLEWITEDSSGCGEFPTADEVDIFRTFGIPDRPVRMKDAAGLSWLYAELDRLNGLVDDKEADVASLAH